jgi:hypothetical protein
MKILLRDFNANVGREDFLNQKLLMRVYMQPVVITGLEQ